MMRSEYWSWTQEMRDAHLWLTNEGKLVMAWGWCGDASHLLPLRDLEDVLGKADAVIAVVGEQDDPVEVYRAWGDLALDVIVVAHRAYIGIFRPPQFGLRREYHSAVAVEARRHWWVTDAGVTTVALGWRDLLTVLAGAEQEDEEEPEESEEA